MLHKGYTLSLMRYTLSLMRYKNPPQTLVPPAFGVIKNFLKISLFYRLPGSLPSTYHLGRRASNSAPS